MGRSFASNVPSGYIHGAGIALLVLAGAAFMYFQARPVVAARAQARDLTAELATRRDALQQLHTSRKDTDGRIVRLKAELTGRLVKLVPKTHLNERLEQLSQLVEDSGLSVDRLSPADAGAEGPFPSLQLKLAGRGPYHACERLIEALHSAFADTSITSMHVKATPEKPDEPVSLDLELLWYTAAEVPESR